MRAASSGVRPPSASSGTSAQPSGTNTTYFTATDSRAHPHLGWRDAEPQPRVHRDRRVPSSRCSARAAAAPGSRSRRIDRAALPRDHHDQPRRRRPRRRPARPTTTTRRRATRRAADLAAVHVRLQTVVSGLSSPVDVVFRPGATTRRTMYVVEQTGTLRVVDERHGRVHRRARPQRQSEPRQRAGLPRRRVLARRHAALRRLHRPQRRHATSTSTRCAATPPIASTRRRVLVRAAAVSRTTTAARSSFGPDGMLYIGLGDGGSGGRPARQRPEPRRRRSRKILRIDPTAAGTAPYSVPADNPFVGRSGRVPEIWMWGLRNPWRFSFDRATGDMWIGDVGQNNVRGDRLRARRARRASTGAGARARASTRSRARRPAGARDPIARDAALRRLLRDRRRLRVPRARDSRARRRVPLRRRLPDRTSIGVVAARRARRRATRPRHRASTQLTTFGEDDDGELYVVARDGTVFRSPPSSRIALGRRQSSARLSTAPPMRRVIACGVTAEKLPSTLLTRRGSRPPGSSRARRARRARPRSPPAT